jgi:uncharacterized protein YbjT (DUF2867 family)
MCPFGRWRGMRKGKELDCEFAVGDFDDPVSMVSALEGVDRLLLNSGGALPVDGQQPMVRQQTGVIDTARAVGVSWVVKVSAWRPGPDAKLSVRAHWEIEQHLKASGLRWASLQPTGYMRNFLTGEGGFAHSGAVEGHVDRIKMVKRQMFGRGGFEALRERGLSAR